MSTTWKATMLLISVALVTCLAAWIIQIMYPRQIDLRTNEAATINFESKDRAREPYVRAVNDESDYETLLAILDRFDVRRELVNQVLELEQGALVENDEVLGNPNLPSGVKEVCLEVLRQQVVETLRGELGAECFSDYQHFCGAWIDSIGKAKASKAEMLKRRKSK